MSSFITVGTDIDISARHSTAALDVVVQFTPKGSVTPIGSIHLDVDDAFALVDQLQEALRQSAHAQARQLHRNEDGIRSSAEIREGL